MGETTMKDPKNPSGFYRDVAPWMIDDIDPETGKLTQEHMEECTGCPLCERND